MRLAALTLSCLFALSAVALVQAAPAGAPTPAMPATEAIQAQTIPHEAASDNQAAICVAGDVYNTGSLPCRGLVCYGQTQYAWQNCVGTAPCLPPRCHIPPPSGLSTPAAGLATSSSDDQVAICVLGDAYNTGGSPCEGVVCLGWTMGRWVDCYPRLGPCTITCPPPPPAPRVRA